MALKRAMAHATKSVAWIGVAVLGLAMVPADAAPAEPLARRGACTIVGTPGDDVLVGTPRRDVICGFGGDDRIDGRGGNDVIRGGDGDDIINGGPGDDLIWGGAGDDVLRGGDGDDRIRGGAGNDILYGGRGNDGLRGGNGDDRLYGGPGIDRLWGKAGHDVLSGGPGRDGLSCGTGGDKVVGGKGDAVGKDCAPSKPTPPDPEPEPGPSGPTAVDDSFSTDEDTVLELPVTGPGSPAANDTDPDDDVLTVVAVGSATGGTVALVGGTIRFTPTPDRCGPTAGGFGYTVSDGTGRSATGRVVVAIACVDDDPVAVDDTATVAEDSGASAVPVLDNDTDADGDDLVIGAVTQPAHGTVVVTGGGTGLTYAPDANYCTGAGDDPDTFTYELTPGGSTATVRMRVTCVDDAPVAVGDAATVGEHAPWTDLDVLANDTDIDGGPLEVAGVGLASHGEVAVAPGRRTVRYRPVLTSACVAPATVTDSFTYVLNGGSVATVTVTITCVTDAAVAVPDTATVTEDDPATAIDVLANDQARDETLAIDAVTQPAHGTVVITGGGTGLTYRPDADYCNSQPGGTRDTFTYTLAPGGSSATVSVEVTCVLDPLELTDDVATVSEDAPATAIDVLANDGDPEGGSLEISAVTQPAHGTVAIVDGGQRVTYRPDPDYCNSQAGGTPDTFGYTVNDGPSATVRVTVTCVVDAAVAVPDTATVTEDDPATAIDVLANDQARDETLAIHAVTQPAHGTVVITGGGTGLTYRPDPDYCNSQPGGTRDTFTYTLAPGGSSATVSVEVTCVLDPLQLVDDVATVREDDPDQVIEVLTNDTDPERGPLAVTAVTQPAHGTVAIVDGGQRVTYRPDPDYCNSQAGGTPDTFGYTVNDGPSATVRVTVTCVYDPPVAHDDAATVDEDTSINVPVTANDLAGDDPAVVVSVTQPLHGTVAIVPGGLAVSYLPHANYCNTPGGPADEFTYALPGNVTATVAMTVTCVNDAPVAVPQSFTGGSAAVGNTSLVAAPSGGGTPSVTGARKTVVGNLLTGASDVDSGTLTVIPETVTTTAGGTAVLESDGGFAYHPPAGCTAATDTFTYRVSDGYAPTPGQGSGVVTVGLAGCVWYVSNSAAGNAGTSDAPFDTLAQAATASKANDTIYVARGTGDATGYGPIALKDGQRLLGQTRDLAIGGATLATGVPGARPLLAAIGIDVVSLASGNTVAGLALDPAGASSGIAGGSGDLNGTITDIRVIDTLSAAVRPGVVLDGTSGTFDLTDLVVDNTAATGATSGSVGLKLRAAGTVRLSGQNRLLVAGAPAFTSDSTALGGSQIERVAVTGSTTGGIDLLNSSGAVTLGKVDLQTTGGTTAALRLQGTGAVTSTDPTSTIVASGGPAVEINGAPASQLELATVSSTSSGSRGISITGLTTGTFKATGGTLSGATATAFYVDGGSGDVTYGGAINDGTGGSVEVRGRSAGTVTVSGQITDGTDIGGGVLVTANTGGSTVLSGAGSTLRTGAADGIVLSASPNHALTLSGGNLQVTTTSGKGVDAAGSGGLTVTGAGNRIASTTGRALGVATTPIGSGNLVLESVSSNGAPNGIRLDSTGTAGSLQVTGTSSTCSVASTTGCTGGEIANSTGTAAGGSTPDGTGVVLTNTKAPSLARMWIHDASNYALRGDRTGGLTLTDSVVNGLNGDADTEAAVVLTELSGTATIARTRLGGGYSDTLRVTNTTGDLGRLTIDAVTFAVTGNRPLNDALQLDANETAGAFPVTVNASTFDGAAGDQLQYGTAATKPGELVLTGNVFTNTHPATAGGGGGVTVTQGGSTALDATVTGNQLTRAVGAGFLFAKSPGSSVQRGTFANNRIGGLPGSGMPGSLSSSGLKLQNLGGGAIVWAVTDNQVRGYNTYGVEVVAGGGGGGQSGVVQTTVTGNTIAEPGTSSTAEGLAKQGLHYNIGTATGDTFQACADIRDNTLTGSGADGTPATGINVDVRLRQRQLTTFRLVSYVGANNDATAVQTYLAARNTGAPTVRAEHSVASGGGGYVGVPVCPAVP
ncbi:tandem-95 repeat protein [Pimelobacter simplex]|uniref:Tandem-95 repeat protein n=1 Tax=Nocardioides simplex TaxID=2045 RepID=A0A7J5DXK9_NOCSI|nr:Ig-like domain-containing protein [Pimelobacter simplex]KAB2810663.1 tandem-95 repeat protein [Pimelobacter simplex]